MEIGYLFAKIKSFSSYLSFPGQTRIVDLYTCGIMVELTKVQSKEYSLLLVY